MTEEKAANNIILCGLPGVGKTSVGRLLAKKMERGFIDTDDEIEQIVGMSCREYYQKLGREAFRKIESETILKLIGQTNKVIALGGGCIESTHVYAQFKRLGSIVHLCNDVDFLAQRKIGHDKPAYIKGRDDYHKLAAYRLPLFYSVADFNLHLRETTIHEAVEMIMAEIKRIHGK